MATIIDQLFVTLGIDPSAFKKGAKEAKETSEDLADSIEKDGERRRENDKKNDEQSDKSSKKLQKDAKNNSIEVRKLRNQLLAVGAIFTGGLGMLAFAKHTISTSANLGRLSENIDMSETRLRSLQLAHEAVGGSADGMSQALRKANQTVATVKTGQGDWTQFSKMQNLSGFAGINLTEQRDFKSTESVLMAQSKLIQAIAQKHGMAVAFQKAQSELGMDEATFNLLKNGPQHVNDLADKYKSLAEKQADLAKKSQELQIKLLQVKTEFQTVATEIMTTLIPVFERALAVFQDFSSWLNKNQDNITVWLDSATQTALEFASAANKVAEAIGGWEVALGALLALKVGSFVTGLASIPAALAGAAGVGGYMGGSKLYEEKLSGTGAGDWIGSAVAHVLAALGSDEAKESIAINKQWKGATESARANRYTSSTSSSSQSISIGKIDVVTKATDANGIARDMRGAILGKDWMHQLNTGVK